MLTILICKLFHIKRLTQECEWISISVTDCNILSIFSFVAAVFPSWFPQTPNQSLGFGYEVCLSE